MDSAQGPAPAPSAEDLATAYEILRRNAGDLHLDANLEVVVAAARAEGAREMRERCARAAEGWSAPENEFVIEGDSSNARGLRFMGNMRHRIAAVVRALKETP